MIAPTEHSVERLLTGTNELEVLADGDMTGGAYSLFAWNLGVGQGPKPHTHGHEDEAIHVIDGCIETFVAGQRRVVRQGEFVFMPRAAEHWFRVVEPARLLHAFSPSGIEDFFRRRSDYQREHGHVPAEVIKRLQADHREAMAGRSTPSKVE